MEHGHISTKHAIPTELRGKSKKKNIPVLPEDGSLVTGSQPCDFNYGGPAAIYLVQNRKLRVINTPTLGGLWGHGDHEEFLGTALIIPILGIDDFGDDVVGMPLFGASILAPLLSSDVPFNIDYSKLYVLDGDKKRRYVSRDRYPFPVDPEDPHRVVYGVDARVLDLFPDGPDW